MSRYSLVRLGRKKGIWMTSWTNAKATMKTLFASFTAALLGTKLHMCNNCKKYAVVDKQAHNLLVARTLSMAETNNCVRQLTLQMCLIYTASLGQQLLNQLNGLFLFALLFICFQ